jgi:hypothetical protein
MSGRALEAIGRHFNPNEAKSLMLAAGLLKLYEAKVIDSRLYEWGDCRREDPTPLIVLMSSGRLFLDRVARQQCPSPLHRQHQNKTLDVLVGRIYHQTVNSGLTVCLSPGGHGKPSLILPSEMMFFAATPRL